MNAIDPDLAIARVERQRQANRHYYHTHANERSQYHREWYEANKDRLREHYKLKARERRLATRNLPEPTPQE